jgi:hypothetical protein
MVGTLHAVEESILESSKILQIRRSNPIEGSVAMIDIILPPASVEEFAGLMIPLRLVVEGAIAAPQPCRSHSEQ